MLEVGKMLRILQATELHWVERLQCDVRVRVTADGLQEFGCVKFWNFESCRVSVWIDA